MTALLGSQVELLRSLLLWARRREHGVPAGATAIPYGRDARVVGFALLVVSLVELAVVEIVVPWPAARAVLLGLGVYGTVVVLGLIAGPAVRPHVLSQDTLRLRAGPWADLVLPLGSITAVSRARGDVDALVRFHGSTLVLATGDSTQLALHLDGPQDLRVGRRAGSADTVRITVDDPAAAVTAIAAAVQARRRPTRSTE